MSMLKTVKTLPNYLLIALINLYRFGVPLAWRQGCRYHPTCSDYAMQALRCHGTIFATFLILKRIGRCNPFGGFGFDPVPQKKGHL